MYVGRCTCRPLQNALSGPTASGRDVRRFDWHPAAHIGLLVASQEARRTAAWACQAAAAAVCHSCLSGGQIT